MTLTTCPRCGMTSIPVTDGRINRHGNTTTGECHGYSHSHPIHDVDGIYIEHVCYCGSVWHRGECLGGHEEIVAFLKEVTSC